jgi:hypothetical protein
VEKKDTKGLEGMHELKYSEIEMENAILKGIFKDWLTV